MPRLNYRSMTEGVRPKAWRHLSGNIAFLRGAHNHLGYCAGINIPNACVSMMLVRMLLQNHILFTLASSHHQLQNCCACLAADVRAAYSHARDSVLARIYILEACVLWLGGRLDSGITLLSVFLCMWIAITSSASKHPSHLFGVGYSSIASSLEIHGVTCHFSRQFISS